VSVNLAQAAAAMGQGVLLVDADLRRPQVHTRLFTKRTGTQQRYFYKLAGFRCYPAIALMENLFVLTSGQIPPDPTKLLSSKKMQNIMELLRQNFDLVIYDTPPLLGLAVVCLPTLQLERASARMGKTDHSVLMQALDRLKFLAPQSGTVCNGVKITITLQLVPTTTDPVLPLDKSRDNSPLVL